MGIILFILFFLTCMSLLIRKDILKIITCICILGALIGRDLSVEARVRNDYYATSVRSEAQGPSIDDFHQGVRAVVIYLRDTRMILYVSAALLLLLQAVPEKRKNGSEKVTGSDPVK